MAPPGVAVDRRDRHLQRGRHVDRITMTLTGPQQRRRRLDDLRLGTRTATFTPSSSLAASTTYTAPRLRGARTPPATRWTRSTWTLHHGGRTAGRHHAADDHGADAGGRGDRRGHRHNSDRHLQRGGPGRHDRHGLVRAGRRRRTATSTYNATTRTATFTPTAALAGIDDVHRHRVGGQGHRGQHHEPGDLDVHHRGAAQQRLSVHDLAEHRDSRPWPPTRTPAPSRSASSSGPRQAGKITGIRFYKGRATPERTSARCGPGPAPARHRSPSPARPRAAGSRRRSRRPSPSAPTRPTWRRTSRRSATTPSTRTTSPRRTTRAR